MEVIKAKPPKKLSAAIMLALNDLALIEFSPKYKVDMTEAHKPQNVGPEMVCHVCFAGSVMAKTCKLPYTEEAMFDDDIFTELGWESVFESLDFIRRGKVADAISCFYNNPDNMKPPVDVWAYEDIKYDFKENGWHYADSPKFFKNCMLEIAQMLKVNGL